MKELFVDTGAWVALNNKKDKYHSEAVRANKDFLDKGYFYITSGYVLDETYTLLRYDVGHKRAVEFGGEIKSLHVCNGRRSQFVNLLDPSTILRRRINLPELPRLNALRCH